MSLYTMEWEKDVKEILYTEAQIAEKVLQLGQQISKDYFGKKIVCIGMLNGAFVFMADLIRKISVNVEVDFMSASSYGVSTVSSGQIKIRKDVTIDLTDKHVLLVEDIIDTGNTLSLMRDYLISKRCASVNFCCFLDKIARRNVCVDVKYTGFVCPDEFLIGYGLDYAENYRGLPYIGILKPEVYIK